MDNTSNDRASPSALAPPSSSTFVPPPNQPRRTRSAYTYYVQAKYREFEYELRHEPPRTRPMKVIRALAAQWRRLKPRQRLPYVQREQADFDRYQTEKVAWYGQFTNAHPRRYDQRRRMPGAPKRPRNAYVQYKNEVWKEIRLDRPSLNPKQVERDISNRWRDMDSYFRVRYERLAAIDRVRYAREMKEFRVQYFESKMDSVENLETAVEIDSESDD